MTPTNAVVLLLLVAHVGGMGGIILQVATTSRRRRTAGATSAYIVTDPLKPGVANARMAGSGTPIWALVPYLKLYGGDYARIAGEFDIPLEAVEAAAAYYRQNRAALEARINTNFGE